MKVVSTVLLAVCLFSALGGKEALEDDGWEKKVNDDGQVVQQLKVEAPAMTEEDQYGYVMPERYRCDSCKAVIFHLDENLRKKQPQNRRLKEWEYTDVFEETCRDAFQGYGIKSVDGENVLSGKGISRESKLQPGGAAIQMSSDNWSKRLGEICRKMVFEKLGEDEVYDRFYKSWLAGTRKDGVDGTESGGFTDSICTKELRECQVGPVESRAAPSVSKKRKIKDGHSKEGLKKKSKAPLQKTQAPNEKRPFPKGQAPKDGKLDVNSFLRQLSVRHGFGPEEYVASRSTAEWEKLLISTASRIFNRVVDDQNDEETCAASRWGKDEKIPENIFA